MTPSGCAAQFVFGDQSKLTVGSGVDSYYEFIKELAAGGRWRETAANVERRCGCGRRPFDKCARFDDRSWPTLKRTRRSGTERASSVLLAGLASAGGARGSSGRVDGPAPRGEAAGCLRRGLRRDADEPGAGGLARERRRLHQARRESRHLLRPETIESVFWMYRASRQGCLLATRLGTDLCARKQSGSTPRRASGTPSKSTLQ